MGGNTFIQVPNNIDNSITLKRFLSKLVLELDVAFGNRGNNSFTTNSSLSSILSTLDKQIKSIDAEGLTYIKLDGSRELTGIQSYDTTFVFTNANELITKSYVDTEVQEVKDYIESEIVLAKDYTDSELVLLKNYVDTNFTNNPIQLAITDLALTISSPPTQAQVQSISNKVDSILAALRSSNIIS